MLIREYQENDWIIVMNTVKDLQSELGEQPWTAMICRYLNDLPESEKSVIYCGLCGDYANQRKRRRAERLPMLLPGFEEGAYQLHAPCSRFRLRRLQGILGTLESKGLVGGELMSKIPDSRNNRGYDFATRWEFYE